jgi:tetratricopeptide (TPR) repeat protein
MARAIVLASPRGHHRRHILVIQRSASSVWLGTLLGAHLVLAACGGSAPRHVLRTMNGSTARGAFVPPGSYAAYVRGELLLLQGRPHEAVAQLDLATTAPDEDAYLLSRLAYAQLLSGDRAEAAHTLDRAAELDRCSEAVWLMRGTLAETTQEQTVARFAYEKASSCAPFSPRGELALSRLLAAKGEPALALDVLTRAAERTDLRSRAQGRASTGERGAAHSALRHSLQTADAATLAHALEGLGAARAPSADTLEQAIVLALDRGLPRLALHLRDQHKTRLPTVLEARLLSANGLLDQLAALLASHDSDAFGGHAPAAQVALEAGAYERAELEASSALMQQPSDAMFALRARAALALGRLRAALPDVAAVHEDTLRRTLLSEALAASGAPALAHELGSQR